MKFMNALNENSEILTSDEGDKVSRYFCPECQEAELIWIDEYDSVNGPVNSHFKTRIGSKHNDSCALNTMIEPEVNDGVIQIGMIRDITEKISEEKNLRVHKAKKRQTPVKYDQLRGVLKYLMGYESAMLIKSGRKTFSGWKKIHFAANFIRGYANDELLDLSVSPFYSGRVLFTKDGITKIALSKKYDIPTIDVKLMANPGDDNHVLGQVTSTSKGVLNSRFIRITDEENNVIQDLINNGSFGFCKCCQCGFPTLKKYPNLSRYKAKKKGF